MRSVMNCWAKTSNLPPALDKKMFFSEEKNQKTFIPALADRSEPGPESWEEQEKKSLLPTFYGKKELSQNPDSTRIQELRYA
jgi:hypothetical protein